MLVTLYVVTVCMYEHHLINVRIHTVCLYVCMYVCMGIVSPVCWPEMARKVSMEFEMAFNHKFLPALEDAEKLMKDLDLGNACNIMYIHSQIYC